MVLPNTPKLANVFIYSFKLLYRSNNIYRVRQTYITKQITSRQNILSKNYMFEKKRRKKNKDSRITLLIELIVQLKISVITIPIVAAIHKK